MPTWTSASVASSTDGRSVVSTLSSATSPWSNGRTSTTRAGSALPVAPPSTEPVITEIELSIGEPFAEPSTDQLAVPNAIASSSVTPGIAATACCAAAAMNSALMPFGVVMSTQWPAVAM